MMSHTLFFKISQQNRQHVQSTIDLLEDFIESHQKESWIDLFCGEVVPEVKLKWKGTLQEAYYLFNQIRINTLAKNSLIQIHPKNRGLDWVKINKVISTKFGKIQKESRPQDISIINESLIEFINLI